MRGRLAIAGFTLAAATAWLFLRAEHPAPAAVCQVCLRPLHGGSAVEAEIDGRRETFCCASCVVAAHRQTGRFVKILHFTNFDSDKPLPPERAFLVRGSEINLCTPHEALMDVFKHPFERRYNRCSPSLLAFASRERAEAFARRHGGTVMPAASLLAELGGGSQAAP